MHSDSWNPEIHAILDVADLVVKSRGFVRVSSSFARCDSWSGAPEARRDRIGYVVVLFDKRAREATLLGYVQTAADGAIDLGKLSPIASPNPWLFL